MATGQSVGTRNRVVLRPWWLSADNGDEAGAEKQGPRKLLAAVFLYDLRSARGGILHITHDRVRRDPSDISSLASAWTVRLTLSSLAEAKGKASGWSVGLGTLERPGCGHRLGGEPLLSP